jgi:iron complex transport system substrate-binding protein
MKPFLTLIFLLPSGACSPGSQAELAPGPAPLRVVVIGPGTEANLFALGLGTRVVGVSDFCTVPEAAAIPRVGGLANPNLERIAALEPDLVLTQGSLPILRDWCGSAGIHFHSFGTDSISGWMEEVRWLGAKFGCNAESEEILLRSSQNFASIAESNSGGPALRVLLIVSRRAEEASGLFAAGPSSFLSELLQRAGGVNVLADAEQAYVDVNEESLIRLDPEAILEFWPDGAPAQDPLTVWRRSFPQLSAVRAGRVSLILHPDSLIPGPAMPATARAIAAALAPSSPPHD